MNAITKNGIPVVIIERERQIDTTQDILDLIADLWAYDHCRRMIVYRESLGDRFFDLKTGFAGDVLQKFSNYQVKLAIVGDFSGYQSKSLKDFIYECNNGRQVFFKDDIESAADALTA